MQTTHELCGRGEEHCCWLRGAVCQYLEENTVPDRRWACGLYRKYGSWVAVHDSPEYIHVRVMAVAAGLTPALDFDCGHWPAPGERCATCGGVGNG